MTARHRLRPGLVAAAAAALLALGAATPAAAHPLGNFTVNHYDGLVLHPDRIDDHAVVDTAEIATLQRRGDVDTDHDGTASEAERARYAQARCADLAATLRTSVDGRPLVWRVTATSFVHLPGNAGLDTGRLTCDLTAPADLTRPARVEFADEYQADRVGWHEITATAGAGLHLERSSVPADSVSGQLRRYPDDMLASPLDRRHADIDVRPGAGVSATAADTALPNAGFVTAALARVDATFHDLVGTRRLTWTAGLLAVLLSLVLGASHAAMPGHGKTVMAAYLAGRRGSRRDAVTVGVTVTVTHTAGVLVLGLLLTASASVAGESLLAWLGTAGGLLITAVGAALMVGAVRGYGRPAGRHHEHGQGHTHGHGHHHHHHGHEHPSHHDHPHVVVPAPATHHGAPVGGTATLTEQAVAPVGFEADHGHPHPAGEPVAPRRRGRVAALVGMGVAGGLVPSPSALIVLLGAIGLGRTWFGVLLVVGYGLGMAATLTAAGLLLVRLGDRVRNTRADPSRGRFARWTGLAPILTAALVFCVGITMALRAVAPLL